MYIFLISHTGKIIRAIVLNRTKFPAFTYETEIYHFLQHGSSLLKLIKYAMTFDLS